MLNIEGSTYNYKERKITQPRLNLCMRVRKWQQEPNWRDIFCLAKYTSSGAAVLPCLRYRRVEGRDGTPEQKKMTINIEERDINIRRGLRSLRSRGSC